MRRQLVGSVFALAFFALGSGPASAWRDCDYGPRAYYYGGPAYGYGGPYYGYAPT
jgi:hypothetical protein